MSRARCTCLFHFVGEPPARCYYRSLFGPATRLCYRNSGRLATSEPQIDVMMGSKGSAASSKVDQSYKAKDPDILGHDRLRRYTFLESKFNETDNMWRDKGNLSNLGGAFPRLFHHHSGVGGSLCVCMCSTKAQARCLSRRLY